MRLGSVTLAVVCCCLLQRLLDAHDYAQAFHDITLSRTISKQLKVNESVMEIIHIIRIPKASSSALSTVARRMVGCTPPGPCCRYPGHPPGTCPSKELIACQQQHRVVGCTHHFPNNDALLNNSIPSISFMRDPTARSISAFFYPGIHHNGNCTDNIDSCFQQYLSDPRWRNIVVKMLTGQFAYAPVETCRDKRTCKHSLELATENLNRLVLMGVSEMWELSLLLMHCKLPQIPPELSEFQLVTSAKASVPGNSCNSVYEEISLFTFPRNNCIHSSLILTMIHRCADKLGASIQ